MSEVHPVSFEIGESVIFQKLNDEIVVLNLENQNYFGLDDVGAQMWESLLEHKSVPSIVQELSCRYAVDEVTLAKDLEALVVKLLDAGLIKPLSA